MKSKTKKQLLEENKILRGALVRLGSMEAFEMPRALRPGDDVELVARVATRCLEKPKKDIWGRFCDYALTDDMRL